MGCPSMPVFLVCTVVYSEERNVEMANACVCCGNICNYEDVFVQVNFLGVVY